MNDRCSGYFLPVPNRKYVIVFLPGYGNKISAVGIMMVFQRFHVVGEFHGIVAVGEHTNGRIPGRPLLYRVFRMPEKAVVGEIWLLFAVANFDDVFQLLFAVIGNV